MKPYKSIQENVKLLERSDSELMQYLFEMDQFNRELFLENNPKIVKRLFLEMSLELTLINRLNSFLNKDNSIYTSYLESNEFLIVIKRAKQSYQSTWDVKEDPTVKTILEDDKKTSKGTIAWNSLTIKEKETIEKVVSFIDTNWDRLKETITYKVSQNY